jgi:hypothetical protein
VRETEAGEAHYRYCCNKPSNNSDKYEREAGVTNVSLSYDYLARSCSLIRPFVGSFVGTFVGCGFRPATSAGPYRTFQRPIALLGK